MPEKITSAQLFDQKNLVLAGSFCNQKTALLPHALKRLRKYARSGESAALLIGEYIGENGLAVMDAKRTRLKLKDGQQRISKKAIKTLNDELVKSGRAVVGCCYFGDDFDTLEKTAAANHRKRFRFAREVFLLFAPSVNCFCVYEWLGGDIVESEQIYYCGKKPMCSQFVAGLGDVLSADKAGSADMMSTDVAKISKHMGTEIQSGREGFVVRMLQRIFGGKSGK